MEDDIRWQQRLANYRKACGNLAAAVSLAKARQLSELERQGLIQSFEFTHELAWNLMKDWFQDQGTSNLTGSKDATREAFAQGLIVEGQVWMDMIKSRNQSSHTYNEETALLIAGKVVDSYAAEFFRFQDLMESKVVLP